MYYGKNGGTEHCKGNKNSGYKTYRGWTQTEYQNKHYKIDRKKKEHRATEEEMEGPSSSGVFRNRLIRLNLHEHDDDDDDDDDDDEDLPKI
jgi:hypothetical protein